MKLEAANRLIKTLAKEQSMDLAYIVNSLSDKGIKTTIPDSVPNSVIANASLSSILIVFSSLNWKQVDQYEVEGGIYCSGHSIILERSGSKIKLMHTAPKRVVVWLVPEDAK
jgi:hypothetical protein